MQYQIRPEQPSDYRAVEQLTYRAFQNFQGPPREYIDEHFLVHKMRDVPGFVPELDYVADDGSHILGSILYAVSHILTPDGADVPVLTFGPVSVPPDLQSKGVGTALIRFTLDKAREMGHRAVLITGHTAYYPRFGFRPASDFGITMMDGASFDAFMALELYEGALAGIHGKCRFDPVYEIPREEVRAFNQKYGYPEI